VVHFVAGEKAMLAMCCALLGMSVSRAQCKMYLCCNQLITGNFVSLQKSLQYDNLGPKRVAALQKDAEEWTKRAESAVCSIQDITVKYFKETVKALSGNQNGLHKRLPKCLI